MGNRTHWSQNDLKKAVTQSTSIRQVIQKLGLIPAGGNYTHITNAIRTAKLDTKHFTGKAWRKGQKFNFIAKIKLEDILVAHSTFQSFKLKKRLFLAGLKNQQCELCQWSKKSLDGRIPLELDHINGIKSDNRLENLRILCPNCHSLQLTHRGKNKKRRGGEIGRRPTLKMS